MTLQHIDDQGTQEPHHEDITDMYAEIVESASHPQGEAAEEHIRVQPDVALLL